LLIDLCDETDSKTKWLREVHQLSSIQKLWID
jgi:hypothetical protein